MVTGFEDSTYKILRAIALNEAFYDPHQDPGRNLDPESYKDSRYNSDPLIKNYHAIRNVFLTLGEERFFLSLGGGNTLSRFLCGLEFESFTETDERKGQFYLTEKGVDKLEELSGIVQEDYQGDLRVA
tara:strand:- start:273 stop:656 length:384 start_codon:yes stop_codon:yes gene_type:complete